jgi:isoleucyl-tRNA synthetase
MLNLPQIEEKILKFWEKKKIFEKSLKKKAVKGDFVFYEGPPTANGRPGIHHVLARIYKDIVCRYKTMRGYYVERKAGWDTHGLPVELEVEKEIGITGKPDIEKYGIDKFNQKCKESVWKYKKEWDELTKRIGFWIDLKHPYITYEKEYIETIWWIIEQIWQKGLLYQDYKVVPHCPRCGTTLSSHEVAQGYKNVEENSIYLKFKLKDSQNTQSPNYPSTYFLVWTTTPWTLPGNVALAVNKNVHYVKILKNIPRESVPLQRDLPKSASNKEYWILAKDRLGVVPKPYEIIEEFLGEKLLGLEYEPLYEFIQPNKPAWFVIHGDFVSVEDGTGIVHIAPAFGEEDMEVGRQNNLPVLMTVEPDGKISPEIGPWAGMWVKDADPLIIKDLEERKILLGIEKIRHDYPFCWRCDTPLIYYAKPSWFIKMSEPKIKQALIKNNQEINWVPEYIKDGRFGEWLKEIKDWAVSRERYWGTPLPIWECQSCNYRECVGSFEELSRRTGKKIPKNFDPHRPFIDEWAWQCPRCGGIMKRVPEVLDCWFDSGSMPFAQWHYPFENKTRIDTDWTQTNAEDSQRKSALSPRQSAIRSASWRRGLNYPADFIAEGIDQTRGWFYTLLAISTLLERGTCYKNVICLGLVLDAKGQKMSKSRGNVIYPLEVINQYGADSLRWYLYTINQAGESKLFDIEGVKKVVQRFFLTLWNCFQFYELFTNCPRQSALSPHQSANVLDQWIITKLNLLIKTVTERLDKYDITGAAREIENFVNDLSLWYIRRSRDRLKEAKESRQVLGYVLLTLAKLLAPFIPFLSEEIYQRMRSAHRFPTNYEFNTNIRITNPKESVHLTDWPIFDEKAIDLKLIEEMESVRQICETGHRLRAEAKIKVRQPLPRLKIKNEKLKMAKELLDLVKDEINVKEIIFDPTIQEEIVLDTEITPELKEEGILRELIHQINFLRKEAKLTIKNKINLYYQTESTELKNIFQKFFEKIKEETISKNLIESESKKAKIKREVEIEGQKIILALE